MVFFPPTPLLHMHCGFILLPEFRFEECVELTVASALRTGCEILSGLVGTESINQHSTTKSPKSHTQLSNRLYLFVASASTLFHVCQLRITLSEQC